MGHVVSPLPVSLPLSLWSNGRPGFTASDRKSIERTVCNPTITLSPNEETVIQSLSLYLNKTATDSVSLRRSQQRWDVNTPHSEVTLLVFNHSNLLFSSSAMYLMETGIGFLSEVKFMFVQ